MFRTYRSPYGDAPVVSDSGAITGEISLAQKMSPEQTKGLKVPFGLLVERLVSPDDNSLPPGLNCDCRCPGCGTRLVLKQGTKRRHFAHHNAPGSNHCVESAIHAAAKQVLIECGGLVVPAVSFSLSATTMTGAVLYEEDVISTKRRIRFDHATPEVSIENIRPDVVGYRDGRQLLVEMYFRHRVDEEKRGKLKRLGIPAVEIDLSDLDLSAGFNGIRERVVESVIYKEWLLYPRSDEHIEYLRQKLQTRVSRADEAYKGEVERKRKEREKLAMLERARRVSNVDVDIAFSAWTDEEKEAWLLERLGLNKATPAFLSAPTYPEAVLKIPALLFQASIFERFVFESEIGATLSANAIYPCLQRRFNLSRVDVALQRLAINLYLSYLAKARFLNGSFGHLTGPYYVEHNEVSMPSNTPYETLYDGEPLLSHNARGFGARRRWRTFWPRWRTASKTAEEILAGSPHREALLAALEGLSESSRPASPHHWAQPLVDAGVPLEECFGLLARISLI